MFVPVPCHTRFDARQQGFSRDSGEGHAVSLLDRIGAETHWWRRLIEGKLLSYIERCVATHLRWVLFGFARGGLVHEGGVAAGGEHFEVRGEEPWLHD